MFRFVCLCVLAVFVVGDGTHFMMMQTTDIHGWVSGHPHNATLNADFGDYCSLIQHLHARALEEDFEFLLFDSGDLIEGTGLSDAAPIHGQFIFPIMQRIQNYTALTIGNHVSDIGHAATVQLMEETFVPHYNEDPSQMAGKYLTGNSYMKGPDRSFIGEPYSIYETRYGQKILLMGWLYNFTLEAINTNVMVVNESLVQPWFLQAMQEPGIDMIIATMHIDPTSVPELQQIYTAVRSYHPTLPFILFSGHAHILYFEQLDPTSFTLESGKYFEVLGLVEFDLVDGQFENFTYQWMETSRENFYELAGKSEEDFLTEEGRETKELITYYTNTLHLNDTLGCSPQFFDPDLPIVTQSSLYNLYLENVIPTMVFNSTLVDTQLFIANTATLRYPLYPGRVTVNDIYSIIPFIDIYVYFTGLTGTQVQGLFGQLRLFTSPNLKMTPYFATYAEQDIHRPAYTHSVMKVDPSGTYDVICSEYDSETIGPILNNLYGIDPQPKTYPTFQTSTTALAEYIITQFQCSASCPC